jgi:hypothetical protein
MVSGSLWFGPKTLFPTIWLGIVAPSGLVNKLFPGYLKAWAIETGCHLVNYVAFGAIIGAMG